MAHLHDPAHFMRQAAVLSQEAIQHYDGGPFGCIIVKDGVVIGKGWNHVIATNDPTAHAEVVAIRDACIKLGTPELVGCELYTSAEPCPMCMAAIYWACIPVVYYSNTKEESARLGYEDSIIYKELSAPLHVRKIKMIHLPDQQATAIFADWAQREGIK
ncbi:MAG: nucleoside deaminase [Taibaiella sp.]|nr:nucleoside deaminase [Taibaiella sp.]